MSDIVAIILFFLFIKLIAGKVVYYVDGVKHSITLSEKQSLKP